MGARRGAAPSTGFLLWHLTLRWRAALDHALAPLGITASQYAVLASLHGLSRSGARPSQRELADFSGLAPMYVSKLVRNLEAAGLIERAASRADSRAVELALTARGLKVVRSGVATVRALDEERLAPLGGRDSTRSAALREMLRELLRHSEARDDLRHPNDAALALPPEINEQE